MLDKHSEEEKTARLITIAIATVVIWIVTMFAACDIANTIMKADGKEKPAPSPKAAAQ